MVDWVGEDGTRTAARYRAMAEHQLHGISPSYERLCLGVADDAQVIALLDSLPTAKRQPNLLLATVRFCDGPTDSYDTFRSFVVRHWAEVSATMTQRRTQTNEPRRCTTLLPVLAALPQPLALLEVGTSAGLCLYPDRYAYRYNDAPVLGSSPVAFDCTVTGPAPIPSVLPTVSWRAGLDLDPLDVLDDEDVRWLESLIWPEQTERFEILRKAVALAREDPPEIVQGDLSTDVGALAALAPSQATLVLFHSAVLAYLDNEQRASFRRSVAEIAARRPTVWLSNEGPGVVVDVPTPDIAAPFVLARDGVALAYSGPHGDWLDWFAGAAT